MKSSFDALMKFRPVRHEDNFVNYAVEPSLFFALERGESLATNVEYF
jgi:hypothetical protein